MTGVKQLTDDAVGCRILSKLVVVFSFLNLVDHVMVQKEVFELF